MAKRQCDPTSGSIGLQVYVPGRNGQVVRIRAIPSNPQTPEQIHVRNILAARATAWRSLTEAQRAAWTAAALGYNSQSRLGMSGALTGEQLYVRVNSNLAAVGEALVTAPPALPAFEANVVTGLTITNTAGVIVVKFACTGTSTAFNIISATPPMSQGRGRAYGMNRLGELPEITGGFADFTTLYTAKFGAPAVGQKIFAQTQQMLDGFQDLPAVYMGIVPTAA